MSHTVIWERAASEGLKRLRAKYGEAVKPFVRAVNSLADTPEPISSSKLGGTNLRRLRVGDFRATYEIDGAHIAVKILTVGATPA
ncbi:MULTISPECIES: type II toxin-antitoxin system RelE/ParE family toxin [unclassified Streptomyces]|uniref:type II toxin-antitoxin system RelE family toxin n=1 Tax=unclassified Streptomyces TaxID=2593676 RepID=UPI00344CC296